MTPANPFQIKARLTVMNFLEFAIWGAYLISMGMYLATHGLGNYVFWFYTAQGIVSIFMPAIIGIIADRWIPAQKTLSLCQLLAGVFMIATGYVASVSGEQLPFISIFTLYAISVAFYMPTIGMSNSVAFNVLEQHRLDTVKEFPPIRVFGTVGFIVAELAVNFISIGGVEIQHSYTQFYLSGALSLVLAAYCLTLPDCPVKKSSGKSLADSLGVKAFALFKRREMAIFFIFCMFLGVSLQITNSYGSSYIYQFNSVPGYEGGFWAQNPTFLISISQCAEALCILLIPFCLKRYGIKGVMLIAMFAWVLRFGFFAIGNTSPSGVSYLIMSCIVYGVAFDFFNVSGGLYVDSQTPPAQRSSAQGLFMLMTNGIGASLGTLIAGSVVVNNLVYDPAIQHNPEAILHGWQTSWAIFAAYALVVAIMFMIIFKEKRPAAGDKASVAEQAAPDGFVDAPLEK